MGRKSSNPKRKIREQRLNKEEIERLCKSIKYAGSPQHKKNPCECYNFTPLAQYREGALCDKDKIITLEEAGALLELGVRQSLVSDRDRVSEAGYPHNADVDCPLNIWCIDKDNNVWEAKLGANGEYHGYHLGDDIFKETVLEVWRRKQKC